MTTTNKSTVAPRAAFAAKPISPLMAEYVAWLKTETGYDVDPMSVQLSGVLRGTFQKSEGNQKRIADAAAALAAEKVAKVVRAAQRKAAAEAKAAEKAKAVPATPKLAPKAKPVRKAKVADLAPDTPADAHLLRRRPAVAPKAGA